MRYLLFFPILCLLLADVHSQQDSEPARETTLSNLEIDLKSSPNRSGMRVVILSPINSYNTIFVALEDAQQRLLPHSKMALPDNFYGIMKILWVNERDVVLTSTLRPCMQFQLIRIHEEKNGEPSLMRLFEGHEHLRAETKTSRDRIEVYNGYATVNIQIKKPGGSKLPPGKKR